MKVSLIQVFAAVPPQKSNNKPKPTKKPPTASLQQQDTSHLRGEPVFLQLDTHQSCEQKYDLILASLKTTQQLKAYHERMLRERLLYNESNVNIVCVSTEQSGHNPAPFTQSEKAKLCHRTPQILHPFPPDPKGGLKKSL